MFSFFFFSSRRRHTRYIGDWSSECALPIFVDDPELCVIRHEPSGPDSELEATVAEPVQRRCFSRDKERIPRSEERRVGKEWRTRWWAERRRTEDSSRSARGTR